MSLLRLQDQLRVHIRAQIARRQWTGRALARQANLPQGHLSNFLHSRRGLSLDSMDRLMAALHIDIHDLTNSQQSQAPEQERASRNGMEPIAMVSPENAVLARFRAEQILATRDFSRSFLRKLRPHPAVDRSDWLRFVLIKLDRNNLGVFFPRSSAVTLLVDRYYSSLQPYRRIQPNLYALHLEGRCVVAHIAVCDNCLMLRPREPRAPVEVVRIEPGRTYSDYIVGRICHVGMEL
jgi:hypothetical protein